MSTETLTGQARAQSLGSGEQQRGMKQCRTVTNEGEWEWAIANEGKTSKGKTNEGKTSNGKGTNKGKGTDKDERLHTNVEVTGSAGITKAASWQDTTLMSE